MGESYKESLEKLLNEDTVWTRPIAWAETKTGVKRLYIFFGVVAFLALYMVFGFGAQLVCNVIGFVYPAYASIKAVESANREDDTKWLTYWIVFALFSLCEYFSDLFLSWFPFYWLAKCTFLLWCFLPLPLNGSSILYKRVVRPIFLKHEAELDSAFASATQRLQDLAHNAAEVAVDATLKKGQ